jgi:hypothetical protein
VCYLGREEIEGGRRGLGIEKSTRKSKIRKNPYHKAQTPHHPKPELFQTDEAPYE